MRNQYPCPCYRCGEWVPAGEGRFERFRRTWRVQHAFCAIEFRGTPDPGREADRLHRLNYLAGQTGRKAQKARAELRRMSESVLQPDPAT